MKTKQSFYKIKNQIIKDRLKHIVKNNQKNIAKILVYIIKKEKNKDKNV